MLSTVLLFNIFKSYIYNVLRPGGHDCSKDVVVLRQVQYCMRRVSSDGQVLYLSLVENNFYVVVYIELQYVQQPIQNLNHILQMKNLRNNVS